MISPNYPNTLIIHTLLQDQAMCIWPNTNIPDHDSIVLVTHAKLRHDACVVVVFFCKLQIFQKGVFTSLDYRVKTLIWKLETQTNRQINYAVLKPSPLSSTLGSKRGHHNVFKKLYFALDCAELCFKIKTAISISTPWLVQVNNHLSLSLLFWKLFGFLHGDG